MRYNFSKTVLFKKTFFSMLFALVTSLMCLWVFGDSIFLSTPVELLACLLITLSVGAVYISVAYFVLRRSTFSVDEDTIIFYKSNKEVSRVNLKESEGINILKSPFFNKCRRIFIKYGDKVIKFSVNEMVYRQIQHKLPYYFKSKKDGLIEIDKWYKLKTLALKISSITYYSAVIFVIITPAILGLMKDISPSYEQAKIYFLIAELAMYLSLIIGYAVFFAYKFYLFGDYRIRIDENFTIEYMRLSMQKINFDRKNIIGIKEVYSVFSRIFNLRAVYILWKGDSSSGIQSDCIPFCLSAQDVIKIKQALCPKEVELEIKKSKRVLPYCIFPCILLAFVTVFASMLFSWSLMFLLAMPVIYFTLYFYNRGYALGEESLVFSTGYLTKSVYTIQYSGIEGITATKRFFEKKAPFASYEILFYGYNGCHPLGVYDDRFMQEFKDKMKLLGEVQEKIEENIPKDV